jgi:anti-anti-sigma factor
MDQTDRLAIEITTRHDAVTVSAAGALDEVNAWMLDRPLQAVLERFATPVRVDLSGLSLFGAAGVHVLTDAASTASLCGRDLRFEGTEGEPARVLRLVGRDALLELAA